MTDKDLSFRMQIFIDAAAEEVWRSLTDPDQLARWWDPVRSAEWRVGGSVVFDVGTEYKIDCDVLEFDPPRRLVTTFDCDAYPEHPSTRVTWEIEPLDRGCLLRLVHDEFPSTELGLHDVCQHWPTMIATLKGLLETDPVGAEKGLR